MRMIYLTFILAACSCWLSSSGGVVRLRPGVQVSAGPLIRTVRVGHGPQYVVADPRTAHVFVLNSDDDTVSMLDARSGAVLRTVPVGANAQEIGVDPATTHAFVLNTKLGRVTILNTRTGTVVRHVSVGKGPVAIAVDDRTTHAFVVNGLSNSVTMFDAQTGAVLRTIAVGMGPTAVAVDNVSGHAFTVNSGAGDMSMLDTRTGRVLRTIRVGKNPLEIAVDADRGRAIVLTLTNTLLLDTHVGAIVEQLPLAGPTAVAIDRRTGHAFVCVGATGNGPDQAGIVDTRTGRVVRMVSAGPGTLTEAVDDHAGRVVIINTDP